jgi:hypothetical protein
MMESRLGMFGWLALIWPSAFTWLDTGTGRSPSSVGQSNRNRSRRGPQAVRQLMVHEQPVESISLEVDAPLSVDLPGVEPTLSCDLPEVTEAPQPTVIQRIRPRHPSEEASAKWQSAKHIYRDLWQRGPGRTGGDWEDAEPGYRYGFERAADEHLRGHSWKQVETELTSGFPGWAKQHGYDPRWTNWKSIEEYVQDVWDELAGPLRITRLRRRAS